MKKLLLSLVTFLLISSASYADVGKVSDVKTLNTLFDVALSQKDKTYVVNFGAPWCVWCVKLEPILETLSKEMPKAEFIKVNTDEIGADIKKTKIELSAKIPIHSGIPFTVVIRNGKIVRELSGYYKLETFREKMK